ncbi:MAG: sirohydrochlorin chelatase [Trueperaceae bacterium]|nr:sirohydrochlorin chelatase [Trueperaceae bacterium]
MKAILLIGHGALNKASGAAMIRHAALLRQEGLAPIATAGFLNFSEPTFAQALTRCMDKGATEVIVQPYFLIDGYYVNTQLRKLVDEAKGLYPDIKLKMSLPFGDHPALAELVTQRIKESLASSKESGDNYAVVLMAHGTPKPEANEALYKIAKRVEANINKPVRLAFMECNEPGIPEAIDSLIQAGHETLVAVPYFLQAGGHVKDDLPRMISEAQHNHPEKAILLADYLGFDSRFVEVIRERLSASV